MNLLGYINEVQNNDKLITNNIIINSFNKAGIIRNNYLSIEEEKIKEGYIYDLNVSDMTEIIDDL